MEGGRGGLAGRVLPIVVPAVAASAYAIAAMPAGTRGAAYVTLHAALAGLMLLAHQRGAAARDVLIASLVTLVVLFAAPPFTTHDVDRYLWDGAVAAAGHDPYRLTPRAPEVAQLHEVWRSPLEHARYPTIYPPLALALFTACAALGPGLAFWAWKLVVTLAAAALVALVAKDARGAKGVTFVALSPLLLLEAGVGAHLDVLTALSVAAALAAFERRRFVAAGVVVGAGALVKIAPVALLVPFGALLLADERRRAAVLRLGGAALATIAAGYGAALLAGLVPLGSFGSFFEHWTFGNPLWLGVEHHGRKIALLSAFDASLVLLLASALVAVRRGLGWGALVALTAPFVFSPVVFPWYLLPLVPLLARVPSRFALLWTLTLPLTYEVIDAFDVDGTWAPRSWPLVVVALGWALAAVLHLREGGLAVSREEHVAPLNRAS